MERHQLEQFESTNLDDAVNNLPKDVELKSARDVRSDKPYWAIVKREGQGGIVTSNVGFYQ